MKFTILFSFIVLLSSLSHAEPCDPSEIYQISQYWGREKIGGSEIFRIDHDKFADGSSLYYARGYDNAHPGFQLMQYFGVLFQFDGSVRRDEKDEFPHRVKRLQDGSCDFVKDAAGYRLILSIGDAPAQVFRQREKADLKHFPIDPEIENSDSCSFESDRIVGEWEYKNQKITLSKNADVVLGIKRVYSQRGDVESSASIHLQDDQWAESNQLVSCALVNGNTILINYFEGLMRYTRVTQ